jgi:cellulose synthase/poly-beta-1,6-N-acetylglucosamine synthase-like glycosyltransferase
VIVRDTDHETYKFLNGFAREGLSLNVIDVSAPGQVAALNAGLAAVTGDLIAITDDDAAPHPDWLAQIQRHFLADSSLGGVGGRDWMYFGEKLLDGSQDLVGKLQWFGRTIGNHHLGSGDAREVDILKGANMSYRRKAIAGLRFDDRLKGQGAQVHNDLAFSLAVKSCGWKLIYDPAVAVDHYPAQRFDEDQRHQFNAAAQINLAHNETLVILENLSCYQRIAFLVWSVLVGTRSVFGLVQMLRFLPSERALAIRKWLTSIQGRLQGWQTWRHSPMKNHPMASIKPRREFNNVA